MTIQLYTVTLADRGVYEVTVAAETPKDAESIARAVLLDEPPTLPKGLRVTNRVIEGAAILAAEQPLRTFSVSGTYSVDFYITVPAATREEAERHAKRLYEAQPFPWEHETGDTRIVWHPAQEVVP